MGHFNNPLVYIRLSGRIIAYIRLSRKSPIMTSCMGLSLQSTWASGRVIIRLIHEQPIDRCVHQRAALSTCLVEAAEPGCQGRRRQRQCIGENLQPIVGAVPFTRSLGKSRRRQSSCSSAVACGAGSEYAAGHDFIGARRIAPNQDAIETIRAS